MSGTVMDRNSLDHRRDCRPTGSRYGYEMRALLTLLALLARAGCTRRAARERPGDEREAGAVTSAEGAADAGDGDGDRAAADGADAAGASVGAPGLAGYPLILELRDGQERLGFVAVPLGAREPRPLMVALHGGSETPNKSTVCPAWREITAGYPFVVCPRGFGGNERALGSMGASQVALLAGANPARYRRIAVGDSAHDPASSLRFSTNWATGSGERAIFLCTTSGCEPALRAASRNVAARRGQARLNVAPTQVHGLSPAVVQSMQRDWPWLVEGAEGWQGYAPPADVASLPGRTETFDP